MDTLVSQAADIGKQMHILHLAIYKLSVQLGVDPEARPDFAVQAAGRFGGLDVRVTYVPWRRGAEWQIDIRSDHDHTIEVCSSSGPRPGVIGWAGMSLDFEDELVVTSGSRVSQEERLSLVGRDLAAAKKLRSTVRWAHSLESLSSMWDMLDKEQEKLTALELQLQAAA